MLKSLGIPFKLLNRDTEETPANTDIPGDYVVQLSEQKAKDCFGKVEKGYILTADTIVYVDGDIFEKPKNEQDARRMLKVLGGNTHQVYTGVTISAFPEQVLISNFEKTHVTFKNLSQEDVNWYISTGEHKDKAGAYAVQGKGAIFIDKIDGCYYNVVGLPLRLSNELFGEIAALLKNET